MTNQWARLVDEIIRGEAPKRPSVTLGPTPALLKSIGLAPADLVMATGKIALCRREHPQVRLETWHELPNLLQHPLAAVPSALRDGTLVVVLVVKDVDGNPIVVPIAPGKNGGPNAVLSVYGKTNGLAWLAKQIQYAENDGVKCYISKDFAATMPQPGSVSEETIPSSPGPIPADGTAKPKRHILSIRK
jgi:Phage MuF-C-terminal domain